MKILLVVVLLIAVSGVVGVAHSQNDKVIPGWIKDVAGYWVEDKITDQEFIGALDFLIESGVIEADRPQVEHLEDEIDGLKSEISVLYEMLGSNNTRIIELEDENSRLKELLESNPNVIVEPSEKTTAPGFIVDIQPKKSRYSWGDGVLVTVEADSLLAGTDKLTKKRTPDGKIFPVAGYVAIMLVDGQGIPVDYVFCDMLYDYTNVFVNDRCTPNGWTGGDIAVTGDGNLSFAGSFKVTDDIFETTDPYAYVMSYGFGSNITSNTIIKFGISDASKQNIHS